MPRTWLSATSTGQRPDAPSGKSFKRALAIDPRNALTNRVVANFYLGRNAWRKPEQPLRIVADVTKSPDAQFALSSSYILDEERRGGAPAALADVGRSENGINRQVCGSPPSTTRTVTTSTP